MPAPRPGAPARLRSRLRSLDSANPDFNCFSRNSAASRGALRRFHYQARLLFGRAIQFAVQDSLVSILSRLLAYPGLIDGGFGGGDGRRIVPLRRGIRDLRLSRSDFCFRRRDLLRQLLQVLGFAGFGGSDTGFGACDCGLLRVRLHTRDHIAGFDRVAFLHQHLGHFTACGKAQVYRLQRLQLAFRFDVQRYPSLARSLESL